MKVIVGITGASGIEYAVRLLKELKRQKIETHLIVSEWAEEVIKAETNYRIGEIKKLASRIYGNKELGASISSTSFLIDAMIVVPATVKTVSEIANANCGSLIARAADNMLRTKKKLIICIRETPLSTPALENLYKLSLYGAVIFPLSPGFYNKPKNIGELQDFIVGKILDLLEIKNKKFKRWN